MIQKRKKILITKFTEYRKFNVNWTKRDPDGRINYRDKYYNDVILSMALKSKIVYEVDNGRSISFTDAFTSFMTEASKNRKSINPKLQSDQLFVEYYTTSEVAKYLGLTYENYYDLPTKDPKYFKENIGLRRVVHRLINSDTYGQMAEMQDEQMKERLEFRKNVLKK